MKPLDPAALQHGPELAILATLDVTLVNTSAALAARHQDLKVACWAPDACEDIRLAAAIVTSAHSLRQLIAEYDSITHTRIYNETPY